MPEASPNPLVDSQFVTRRQMVTIGGATLVAVSLAGCASLPGAATLAALPHADVGPITPMTVAGVPVGTLNGGTKPIFVAPPGNIDPVVHSVADTLFWGEQMMEHAMFFVMLMPGPELAGPRGEAVRFATRLGQLNGGNAAFDRREVVPFWADKMEEHALFVSHLLDPSEKTLKTAAEAGAGVFDKLEDAPVGSKDPALKAAQTIINFKVAAEKGIQAGQIKSIIHPALADHVRREAIRFRDELIRAV